MAAVTAGVVAAGASAYSAYKGSKQPKGGTQTQEIPEWQRRQIEQGYRLTNQAANRTADEAVAGFNGDQQAAFDAVRANQGLGYGDLDQTVANARGLTGDVELDINRFMNPYTNDVVNASLGDIDLMRRRREAQIASEAEAAGAFGGDRAAVARALENENFDRTAATTAAGLRSQGFTQAVQNAMNYGMQNRQLRLSGNQQLQQMIDSRRAASQQDANALLGVGNQQQQQDQAMRDWAIERANLVNQSAGGRMGGTTTHTGPRVDRFAAGVNALGAGLMAGRGVYDQFKAPLGTPPFAPKYGSSYYGGLEAGLLGNMPQQQLTYQPTMPSLNFG